MRTIFLQIERYATIKSFNIYVKISKLRIAFIIKLCYNDNDTMAFKTIKGDFR